MASWTRSLFKANANETVEFSTTSKGHEAGFSPSPDRAEQGGRGRRKMNRIDRPRTQSIVGVDTDDSDEDVVKKQLLGEEGNAIKYRTCSWKKVGSRPTHATTSNINAIMMALLLSLRKSSSCESLRIYIVIGSSSSNRWCRLRRCCSVNTYAWPSCRSRTLTPHSVSCQA
jgi:hypothetical protein